MTSEDYFSWRAETENKFQALATTQELKGLLQDYIQSLGFDFFAFSSSTASPLPGHAFICTILILNYGLNVIKNRIIMPSIPCYSFVSAQEEGSNGRRNCLVAQKKCGRMHVILGS